MVGDRVAAWVEGGGFAEQVVTGAEFCVAAGHGIEYPAVAEPLVVHR